MNERPLRIGQRVLVRMPDGFVERRGCARSFSTAYDHGAIVPTVQVEYDGSGTKEWIARRFVFPVGTRLRDRVLDGFYRRLAPYMS